MAGRHPTNGHLVLVGPTASGKSALALEVARHRSGTELVSVDSMAVYRSMDIGTATPTSAEKKEIRHHLIDLVEPTEEFTLAMFQTAAHAVLDELKLQGCRAVLVGGTGLYLRSVVDPLRIPPRYPGVRRRLEADLDTEALHNCLFELDPSAAARMESTNRRRIIRALEVAIGSGRPFSSFGPGLAVYPPTAFTQVGIRVPKEVLDRRIRERYYQQMESGFLAEVKALTERPKPLSVSASQALGYRHLLSHLRGECELKSAIESAVVDTCRFARRQDRWFRRDPRIDWIDVEKDPLEVLPEVLDRFDHCAATIESSPSATPLEL